jgi:hypothetical protein
MLLIGRAAGEVIKPRQVKPGLGFVGCKPDGFFLI